MQINRMALERALIARGVRYIFIDEAQHVKYATKGAMGSYAVMDSWKCLAKTTNSILVVVGAYPILDVLRNSPHLLGRKHQVHIPRYYYEDKDLKEFALIIQAFESKLFICKSMGSLVSDAKIIDLLYDGSLGCIGLLRAWLLRAQSMATVLDSKINKFILLRTKLSAVDLQEISKEIAEGEKLLLKEDADETYMRNDKQEQDQKKAKGTPFQRNPERMKKGNRLGS